MAETQELQENQIVQDDPQGADAQAAESPKKPRAKRPSVKAVENRAAELEQRIETLAEQVAQLSRRLAALEESRHHSQAGDGAASLNGGDLAEHVRQLDDRLQKLANFLTQQNWGMNRV
jgi:uncharacterized phage infection (PIP) family protein YhgE